MGIIAIATAAPAASCQAFNILSSFHEYRLCNDEIFRPGNFNIFFRPLHHFHGTAQEFEEPCLVCRNKILFPGCQDIGLCQKRFLCDLRSLRLPDTGPVDCLLDHIPVGNCLQGVFYLDCSHGSTAFLCLLQALLDNGNRHKRPHPIVHQYKFHIFRQCFKPGQD